MSRPRILTALLAVALSVAGVAVPVETASAAKPRLLVYGHDDQGVYVQRAPNVAKRLPGAPVGFQRFAKRTIHHLHQTESCDEGAIGLSVNRIRTDGFARGGVSDCGGYAALWKRVDGRWREVAGTQDIWTCRELRRLDFPSSVIGPGAQCADGRDVVAYHHR